MNCRRKGRSYSMKILIVRNYPNMMKIQNQSYNIQELGLARALAKKGHTCGIVFWTGEEDKQLDIPTQGGGKITVYYIHAPNILKNSIYPKRLDELAAQYDIVQMSEYNQYMSWKYAKNFKDKTVILHGPYYSPFNIRYNLLCKAFDMFFLNRYRKHGTHFMVKSALAEQFLLDKQIQKEHISKVYVGIDEAALHHEPSDELPEFIENVLKEESKILLYIGRIEERRKSLFLLDVFKQVLARDPDVRLVVVGDGDEGYKKAFAAHMEELGVTDSVMWSLRLEQKYLSHLYEKADVFLLPTEFEIFGMVLLETMYFSKVVVTSYNGGSATLIQNQKNGVYLDSFDTGLWANAVYGLLKDDTRRKEMGELAHQTIANGFLWDTVCERYLACYRKKLGETKRG